MLSFASDLSSSLLPSDFDDAVACCNKTEDLINYINSGQACEEYSSKASTKVWNSDYYKDSTSMKTFLFLKDNCRNDSVNKYHCYQVTTSGAGPPNNNDNWWTYIFYAYVNCTLQLDNTINYYHIWNEPNTGGSSYNYKLNGYDYSEFYYQVTKDIVKNMTNVLLDEGLTFEFAGPVTAGPPNRNKLWENWFIPVIESDLINGKNKNVHDDKLLNYLDYHAYNHLGNSNDSEWDRVISNFHCLSIYYKIKNGIYDYTDGDGYSGYIRTHLTETNVQLNATEANDNEIHWNKRAIGNAKHVIGLSHNSDKVGKRLLYTIDDVNGNYVFYQSIDYYMHEVLRYLQDCYYLQFKIETNSNQDLEVKNAYYDSDTVISQIVRSKDKDANKVYFIFVNYRDDNDAYITLSDVDNNINYNSTVLVATKDGVKATSSLIDINTVDSRNGNYNYNNDDGHDKINDRDAYVVANALVTVPGYSIVCATGEYISKSKIDSKKIVRTEFIPNDEDLIMKILNLNNLNQNINISTSIPLIYDSDEYVNVEGAYFKIGCFNCSYYQWTLNVKMDGVKLDSVSFVPELYYLEIDINNDKFLNKIENNTNVEIDLEGKLRAIDYGSQENNLEGSSYIRFGFISLVVDFSV